MELIPLQKNLRKNIMIRRSFRMTLKEGKLEEYTNNLRNSHIQSAINGYEEFMKDKIKESNDSFVTEAGDVENWRGGKSKEQVEQEPAQPPKATWRSYIRLASTELKSPDSELRATLANIQKRAKELAINDGYVFKNARK